MIFILQIEPPNLQTVQQHLPVSLLRVCTMFTRRSKLNLSAHTQQAHLLTAGRACIPQLMRLPTGTGIFIHATGCEFYQHSSGGQKKVLTLVCGKKCALSDVSHVLRTC